MSGRSRSTQVRFDGFAIDLAIDITSSLQEALVWTARDNVDLLDTPFFEPFKIFHLFSFGLAIVNKITVLALLKLLSHSMVQISKA